MKKAAVIVAPGFEEAETLTIVDILRRCGINCETYGWQERVEGGHHVTLLCDHILSEEIMTADIVILPGGYGGVEQMLHNELLLDCLKRRNEQGRYIAAMCAAPIVLAQAGLLSGRQYTAYVGYDKKINQGTYREDIVVVDQHIITSRGPATVYAFAYRIAELLGAKTEKVKQRMLYHHAFKEEKI